jgi:hypothetical protein
MCFSDGDTVLDCTDPVQTIALTAGTDSAPQANYIYIPQSTGVLTKHTSQWPSAEHIKVGYFLVPSAVEVQSDGVWINQNWNDHRMGTDSQGHLSHLCETIRLTMRGAVWNSGVAGNATASEYLEITGTAPSVVEFKSTAGVVYQMHRHVVPAIDMSGSDDCHVVNWNGDAYHEVSDLADIVADSAGGSLSNRHFNLVFWGVANKTGEYSPLMCNVPAGSYSTQTGAQLDLDNYTITTIPDEFTKESSTGFLICRLTVHQDPSGTWTLNATEDLRGVIPGAGTGAAGAGGSLTDFPDNQFTLYDSDDNTRVVNFDLSGITTGNTRTITPADADMTLLSTTDYTDLTDSGATTLHKHDHGGQDGLGDDDHTQYILHSLATAANDFLVASGSGAYVKKTLAEVGAILEGDINHDNLQGVTANEHLDWTASVGTIHTDNYIEGGAGTDTTAIHDNVVGEINAIADKSTHHGDDWVLLEDSEASWAKKRIDAGTLGGVYALTFNGSTYGQVNTSVSGGRTSKEVEIFGDSPVWNANQMTIEVSNDSGSGMSSGDLCYISGDSSGVPQVTLADADAEASCSKMLVLITETIGNGSDGTALIKGEYTTTGLTASSVYFASTTAGDFTTTAPSAAGDIVRIIGYALSTTVLYFDPDKTFVEIAA